MARRGAYANRNAGHRDRQAAKFAVARNDAERLSAAFDAFRSSVRLLARRRPPRPLSQEVHEAAADRLVREMTAHLRRVADDIDQGKYDIQGG